MMMPQGFTRPALHLAGLFFARRISDGVLQTLDTPLMSTAGFTDLREANPLKARDVDATLTPPV
jgi:hypothetical protein